jgi:hypothetical protein
LIHPLEMLSVALLPTFLASSRFPAFPATPTPR